MNVLAALILVVGAFGWLLLDHYLRLRRARPYPHAEPPNQPPASEERMTMSQQQRTALGLSHVRRAVASGKYTQADLRRWEAELGPKVREIVGEAKQEAAKSAPAEKKQDKPDTSPKE